MSKGRTKRTELLYGESVIIYIYLCYGMHWLMNVITGEPDQPQGVLFRAAADYTGPGKLTKYLQLDGACNGKPLQPETGIWVEDDGFVPELITKPRVGIDYAGPEWAAKPWRFVLKP